ncbi:restriction endonuclease subunit S [Orenia marismortui]|uniref:Type I restriction enzyme S subunit n=1 Tax=Orenia marismortui TaxID=46469 RepID=A0A4R8HAK7_9FIRM|nr:restriction endonuclease subunit S [Orenia marismortui]TDX52965.1 type I restriction enzyme S subunit [Orenia marismortui]
MFIQGWWFVMVREGYEKTGIGIIPEDWDFCFMGNIVDVNPRYDIPKQDEFLFLEMSAVNSNKADVDYWLKRKKEDCTSVRFKEGDTLFARITPCAENGKTAFIEKMDDELAFGSTEFIILSPKQDLVLSKYVYYLSKSHRVRSLAISMMEGSTGRQRVPREVFVETIKIPLPPLLEQKKIADILSSVDEAIAKTEEIINQNKELKKGLMQELLTKGIGHSKFKEVRLGIKKADVPKNWEVKTMSEMSSDNKYSLVDGPFGSNLTTDDYRENGDVRLIQLQNIKEFIFCNDEKKYTYKEKYEEQIRSAANPGDIVLAKMPDPIGRACIVPDIEKNYLVVADVIKFKPNEEYNNIFAMYFFNSKLFRDQVESYATGSTRLRLNLSNFKNLDVLVPPLDEQEKIAEILSSVDAKIEKEEEYKAELEQLKKGLMQKLLIGEVRVRV